MSESEPYDLPDYARYAAHAQHAIALLTLWADAVTDDPAELLHYFDTLASHEQHHALLSLVALIAALVEGIGGDVEDFAQTLGLTVAEYLG